MPNPTNEENWAARERLRRVEFLLWWRGWVGRQDLLEVFGISAAQASGDLQRYAALNPGAMIYHTSRKRYESGEAMTCVLHEPSFEEAVRVFLGGDGSRRWPPAGETDARLDAIRLPERQTAPATCRRVLIALMERRTLRVRYHSLNSGSDEWRQLVPGGLAWDGSRWHLRAWCGTRLEWRDFVLGRMAAVEWPGEVAGKLPKDDDWLTLVTVRLRVNPALTKDQRKAIKLDYGLAGETMEIRVRRALKPYLLAAMFIDHQSHADLPRHFVMAR